MRTFAKVTGTTLLAAVLFGFAGMSGVADAAEAPITPPAGDATVSTDPQATAATYYGRQFTITNKSSKPLTVTSYRNEFTMPNSEDKTAFPTAHNELPPVGSVVAPGAQIAFQISWEYGYNNNEYVTFSSGWGDTYTARLQVASMVAWTQQNSWASTVGTHLAHTENGDQLTVLDAANTVINVPAADTAEQSTVLNTWCTSGVATCVFHPTSQQPMMSEPHNVANIPEIKNGTLDNMTRLVEISDTQGTSNNLEINASVTATILDVVEASLSVTYGQTWTQTHEFTDSQSITVRPYHVAWVVGETPIIRTTGDFDVTMGNTTWKLHDATFDAPNLNGRASFWFKDREMTAEEIEKSKKFALLEAARQAELGPDAPSAGASTG